MEKICRQCGASFQITEDDLAFYDRISPVFDDRKYGVPPPSLCPDCRFQRRLMFRNDRHFYHRPSAKNGKELITIYSPDKPYTVLDKDEWWADDWDPRSYGRDIDFSRPFFEQFQELRRQVPRANLFQSKTENSDYTNHALNMRNCYLIWGGGENENCLYGNFVAFCKDTLDALCLYSCEWCYEGISSDRCYECIDFNNCRDCVDCIVIEECSSCKHCIGCFGLHRKEYCLFNEEVGKDAWEKRSTELGSLTAEKMALLRERLHALKRSLPHRASHIFGSEDCTGDGIYNSRNCHYCFDIKDCEDCKFTAFTPNGVSSQDCCFTAPDGPELSYDICSSLGQRLFWTFLAYHCDNTFYSMECHECSHLFGCASLRRNEYCILNTQYTKEEYEALVEKLIEHMKETGEWGEYFPPALAPICYNESNAHDYFPLTREQVLAKDWQWYDGEEQKPAGELLTTIPARIEDVDDSICDRVLTCIVTGRAYKIVPQELRFYRKMKVPIPRYHPHERHRRRMLLRNPRKLWPRTCMKCQQPIQTTYSPERPEVVYCESCYLQTVY